MAPLALTTLAWLLTIGSFDYMATVHHDAFLFFTGFAIFSGIFAGGAASDND